MDRSVLVHEISIEKELLKHIKTALRLIMDWKNQGDAATRKLRSLQFVAHSFERHMNRLLSLVEEADEQRRRHDKKLENDRLRESLHHIIQDLEQLRSDQETKFEAACDELQAFLKGLDERCRASRGKPQAATI